ncbi:threonine-phosphate decarboxylase [Anaeromicropila herbilytica]|uniref:Threonine-phosphate decarboxylase n=2 Tax=Anaeromicropila herbilytica TaxID=2785025 RepID=A0A7R7IBU9_9FIRM|nr:threonine-phosphate decarboxylase [Anaeromicropila herbilytica]
MKHVEHFHGSDLEKIEQIYHIKKEDITSFSANVNPLGVSKKLRQTLSDNIDVITSYPDREYTSLRKEIGKYVKANYENIIVGNGSTELISLLIQIKHPKNALLIGPTYSEYERELNLAGCHISNFTLKEDVNFDIDIDSLKKTIINSIDFLILCNPNNPTSSAIRHDKMRQILDFCRDNNIFVMVDETYVEFANDMEHITLVPLTKEYKNCIVLRGISKFFASPGLRLGYAICSDTAFLDEINQRKNPWTINSLASVAGEIMFQDEEYINSTKTYINSERETFCKILSECKNVKFYTPVANFILVQILKPGITSKDIFERAIKKGLMIRDCSSFQELGDKYIRFCFMSREKNDELLEVLLEVLK